jgi:hypothetical protein
MKIVILVLLMMCVVTMSAQTKSEKTATVENRASINKIRKELKNKIALFESKNPVYVINGKLNKTLVVSDTSLITLIQVVKPNNAFKKYGIKAKKGALEITTKEVGMINQVGVNEMSSSKTLHTMGDSIKFDAGNLGKVAGDTSFKDGGISFVNSFGRFLERNLRYPQDAVDAAIGGNVIIKFMVDVDGTVSKVGVAEESPSKNIYLVNEAVRIINKSNGQWKPMVQNGKKIKSYHSQSINFIISN